MPVKHDSVVKTLTADVGAGGNFTVAYPAGRSADDYLGGTDHYIASHSVRTLFARSGDFSVSFGAALITVTLATGLLLANNTIVWLNLDRSGEDANEELAASSRMSLMNLVRMVFGAPTTAVATAVAASQSLNTGVDGLINGTQAVAGVVTFATPRNVVAAWTGAAVLTVTGTDEFGQVLVEASAAGIALTGKKAFKTVTKIRVSAAVTLLTVGNGVVLGLPAFLADVADILKEHVNGAAAGAAGVFVAGDTAAPTNLTGDVRGTWTPNLAPDAARVYELTLALRSASYRGGLQAIV